MSSSLEAKRQTFSRLAKYAKPYWKRLTVGILAGFVVGGSVFGTLMMLPNLMNGIGLKGKNNVVEADKSARELVQAAEAGGRDLEKRAAAVSHYLQQQKLAEGNRVEKEIRKIDSFLKKIGLSNYNVSYEQGNLCLRKKQTPLLTFPAATPAGKMTWQFLAVFCIAFVMLWALKNLATYINHYCMRWVGVRMVADLRSEIFRKLIGQSLRYFSSTDVGQLISRTSNDTNMIESSIANVIADFTRCPIEILACIAALIYSSIRNDNYMLPIILFAGLPLCVVPIMLIGRQIRKFYQKALRSIADVTSRMHEDFSCIQLVKAYHSEERETQRFDVINRKYFKTVVRAIRAQLFMSPLMELTVVASILVFLTYSYSQEVDLAILLELLAPCFIAYRPIRDLAKVATYIHRCMAGADRYFEIIDLADDIKEAENPVSFTEFKDKIEFRDVVFSYDTHRILDKISFEIPRGSIVAVVGETGSGKTTIANLIARFYDADSGSITLDGKNICDIRLSDLHDMVGVVTQDALLFNESIAANIAYGMPEATHEQIVAAAKSANAHNFIMDGRHPEGYDMIVGDHGFKLSGGEKQRISIARAILKNPPILILDEATSALDTVTEKLVQDALNNVMTNRTVFAIAHRLSTIRNADKIIVLEKGRIVETGTHEELIALNGRYKKLCDSQFAAK